MLMIIRRVFSKEGAEGDRRSSEGRVDLDVPLMIKKMAIKKKR